MTDPRSSVILLTGKNGQVGRQLQRSLAPVGKLIACGWDELDLSNSAQIREVIQRIEPDIIVNAAAYTAVDKAEEEQGLAIQINGTAPGVIAEEAKKIDALVVHYSTDYVFNGEKATPYVETDEPDPINVYGKTKLAGEEVIRNSGADYLIFRTSWIYSARLSCWQTNRPHATQEVQTPFGQRARILSRWSACLRSSTRDKRVYPNRLSV